mgnify:FL=1
MKNHDNVKVGDKFYYGKKIGLNKWGTLYFARQFFLECEVTKVTKAQFTTESGRYRKSDGYCVGDGYNIYQAGDKVLGFSRKDEYVPDRCQKIELSDYDGELQVLRDAHRFDLARFDITRVKGLENAQKAASLIMQLKALMGDSK